MKVQTQYTRIDQRIFLIFRKLSMLEKQNDILLNRILMNKNISDAFELQINRAIETYKTNREDKGGLNIKGRIKYKVYKRNHRTNRSN